MFIKILLTIIFLCVTVAVGVYSRNAVCKHNTPTASAAMQ